MKDDIKEARLAAGLTQAALARLAGIPRKQVVAIENGANVTLNTVRRIVAQLPNLRRVYLDDLEVAFGSRDQDRARRTAIELVEVAKRLLDQLGGPSTTDAPRESAGQPAGEPGTKPAEPARYPVGATRFRGGEYADPRVVEGLELILDSLLKREAARRQP